MRGKILLPVITIFLLLTSFSKEDINKPSIRWQYDRPLSYSDFRGTPDKKELAALTASGIEVTYEMKQNKFQAVVKASFFPEESWIRKHARNAYVLRHEQMHFDITEWHSRELRKKLASARFSPSDEEKLKALIQQHYDNWQKTQRSFDLETHHGLNKTQQARWEKKIAKALEELDDYASD